MKIFFNEKSDDILKFGLPLLIITLFLISISYLASAFPSVDEDGNVLVLLNLTDNYQNNTGTVNFTFTPILADDTDNDALTATLWINSTGTWAANFSNGTDTDGVCYGLNGSLSNGSLSYINVSLPDGSYVWNINYTNTTVWNMSITNRTVTVDNTDPAIGINTPVDNANLTGAADLINVTVTDLHVNSTVYVFIQNSTLNYTVNATTNWTLNGTNMSIDSNTSVYTYAIDSNAFANGDYTLIINASDWFNNSAQAIRTIHIHNIGPANLTNFTTNITVIGTSGSVNDTIGISFNTSWNSTDVSGRNILDTARLQLFNASETPPWTNVSINKTFNSDTNETNLTYSPVLSQGDSNLTFRIWVNDTFGNVNTTVVNITILVNDSTAPSIVIHNPVVNSNLTRPTDLINVTVTDEGSNGINSTVYVYIQNATANYTINATFISTLNATNMSVDSSNTTLFTYAIDSNQFATGKYTLLVNASDLAEAPQGGKNYGTTVQTIYIDNTNPTYTNASAILNRTVVNDGWSVSINVSWVDVNVRPTMDTAVLQMYNITSNYWENVSINTTLGGMGDANANYSNFTYRTRIAQGDTNISFRIWANDSAGNTNTTYNITLQNNDTTVPDVNLTLVVDSIYYTSVREANNIKVWGSEFKFNGTVNEPNLARINYTITNRTNNNTEMGQWINSSWDTSFYTASTNRSVQTTFTKTFNGMYLPSWNSEPGNYTINISAIDDAGNLNWTAFNISSMPAVTATYQGRITAPGYIGSGTYGEYNFTVITKGYAYTQMYLNITNGGNASPFFISNNTQNARLGQTWADGKTIARSGGTGGYGGAESYTLKNLSSTTASEVPYPYNYTNLTATGMMNNVYQNNLTLYLNPYSGLSAGTYTGTYGFALWDSST